MACRRIGIVLTAACNLRCDYCCVPHSGPRHAAWIGIRRSLGPALKVAANPLEVTFTGGEPLLAFATLRRTVAYVEQEIGRRRVLWRVLTNGLLLDSEILEFLDAHRFRINLSFDGVPPAQSLRGRGTHERLDRLVDRLRVDFPVLFSHRLKVCLTLSPPSIVHLSDSVAYFLEKQIATFAISPAIGDWEWAPHRIDELNHQFDKVSATMVRHYRRTGRVPFGLFRKMPRDNPEETRPCGVLNGSGIVIDMDGRAYACLPATRTYQLHPVPVLRQAVESLQFGVGASFERRWTGVRSAARRAKVFEHPERRYSSYKRCTDCEFLGRCRICPLAQAGVAGWRDEYRVSDFLCAFNQVALAHRDRFPAQPTADDFLSGAVPLSALPR